ncbi:MAG: zinc-binding dehydrogenase [Nocardioides sp.]|nr:zinc-binding dehydrogenase [Nocardioides sp.]
MRTLSARSDGPAPYLSDVSSLQPRRHEVLIEVVAAAVNPIDVFVASGAAHPVFGLPALVGLGWDVAGRVAAIGPDVTDIAPGDLVAGLHDDLTLSTRTHAEQVVLPATSVAVVPPGVDELAAASVPLNALTALQALTPLGDGDGRTLLVTGAAGAVGGYAVALAAAAGWHVTGLGRAHDEAWVRGAGASGFVTAPQPAAYDVVFDTAVLNALAVAAVRDGGQYVGVIPPAPPAPERGVSVSAVNVRADGSQLARLLARTASGELEVRVAGTVALDHAGSAYEKLAGGGQRGRWLLVP